VIRTVSFLARRPDLDRSAFRSYYEECHAPLARPLLPGLRHYVRNHVLAERGAEPIAFDAISEFEYADTASFEAMRAMLDGPRGVQLRDDERNFMHKPGNSFFAAERRAFGRSARPSPGGHPKAIALLGDRSHDERARLAARASGAALALAGRIDVTHVELDLPHPGEPLGTPAWEAVLHVWLAPGTSRDHALDRVEASIAGEPTRCCLWIQECGESVPLATEASRP
jgi:uncharacterized protein (TIGR02118 family)